MSLLTRIPRTAGLATRWNHNVSSVYPPIRFFPKLSSFKGHVAWKTSLLLAEHRASLSGLLRVGIPRTVLGRGFLTAVSKGRSAVTRCKRMCSSKSSPRKSGTLSESASGGEAAVQEPEKLTMKVLWERYGTVAIGTHFSVYFATLAALYAAVDQGLLGRTPQEKKEAVTNVADKMAPYLPEWAIERIRSSPTVGAFAVAWLSAKFTEPFRLVVTIFLVPKIARYIGRAPARGASFSGSSKKK